MNSVWHRRGFLEFLMASPVMAAQNAGSVLKDPKDALNVLDFEPAARQVLPPAHFAYLRTGVDDDATLRANSEAFRHIQLRARRLIDVRKADPATELFGVRWETPIHLSPCGNQRAFHEEGELAVARAARSRRTLQILSTVANSSVQDVSRETGGPVWFQLYATDRWENTERLVRRAEDAGCPVLVLTVDQNGGRNTETLSRARRVDTRPCAACHGTERGASYRRKPMFDGLDMTGASSQNPGMTWEFVDRLKKLTRMKLVLKGIVTREDTELCLKHGVDGIIVSNHGGRGEESNRSTIECLPEVVSVAGNLIPVLIDGGIRRGTDIFKALALGARGVGIGRPFLWGLAAFGQPGVERVLDILRAELVMVMKQCGTRSIAEINRSHVLERRQQ